MSSTALFQFAKTEGQNLPEKMSIQERNAVTLRKWDLLGDRGRNKYEDKKEWICNPGRKEYSKSNKIFGYRIRGCDDPSNINVPLLRFPSERAKSTFLKSNLEENIDRRRHHASKTSVVKARKAVAWSLSQLSSYLPEEDALVAQLCRKRKCREMNLGMIKRKHDLMEYC